MRDVLNARSCFLLLLQGMDHVESSLCSQPRNYRSHKAGAPSVRVWRPRLPLLLHMLLCVSALGFPFGFLVYHTEQSHRLREEKLFLEEKALGIGSLSCPKYSKCCLKKTHLWQLCLLTRRELLNCNHYFLTPNKGISLAFDTRKLPEYALGDILAYLGGNMLEWLE